jgi:hypothetical protein
MIDLFRCIMKFSKAHFLILISFTQNWKICLAIINTLVMINLGPLIIDHTYNGNLVKDKI